MKCYSRRSNPKQREIIDKQVAKMLKAGIIYNHLIQIIVVRRFSLQKKWTQ